MKKTLYLSQTLKNVSEVCGKESTMGLIPSQHVYQITN